jgi:microcystin-dependent protein
MLPASFQAVSRTTYAALFAVLGTTWGAGDGSTTFNLPDLRGRATYGLDQGLRITAAGGNFDGTIIGNAGGLQNSNGVGAHTHVATVTDPGHTHLENANTVAGGSSGVQQVATNGVNTATVTATASATTGVTVANASSGATYTVLGPAAIVLKCIQP